jgi:hypothetical protein
VLVTGKETRLDKRGPCDDAIEAVTTNSNHMAYEYYKTR